MKRILVLISGIFTLAMVACVNENDKKKTADEQEFLRSFSGQNILPNELDQFIRLQMDSLGVPGLSIGIINDGALKYHKVFGYANLEDSLKANKSTIFEGASISKTIFAYFVMKVLEDKKLDIDKPLYHYLPKEELEDDARYKEITARMVLNHTTGLPNWRENTSSEKLELNFKPGSNFLYSGEAYQYLAEVLAYLYETDIAGLENIFQKMVAKPLGMNNTSFIENSYTKKHKAQPYYKNGKPVDWKNSYWYKKEKGKFIAASSILTESKDFSKFIIALIERQGLNEKHFNYLLESQVSLPEDNPLKAYGINTWTLGFHRLDTPLGTLIGHGGDNEGFESLFHFNPEKKWGFVVFTNSEGGTELAIKLNQFLMSGE